MHKPVVIHNDDGDAVITVQNVGPINTGILLEGGRLPIRVRYVHADNSASEADVYIILTHDGIIVDFWPAGGEGESVDSRIVEWADLQEEE